MILTVKTEHGRTAKKRVYALCALIIVMFILVGVYYAVRLVFSATYSERKMSMTDTVQASTLTVNAYMESSRRTVAALASIVYQDYARFDSLWTFTDDAKTKLLSGDDLFFLVDSSGRYYSSDGKTGILPDMNYYVSGTGEQTEYLSTLPHLNPNVTFLTVRQRLKKPVTFALDGGTVEIRYCAMMFDLNALNRTVSELFPGANNTIIYDTATGSMLYKQFDLGLLIDGYNVYSKWERCVMADGETAEEMISLCRSGKPCAAVIDVNGIKYYVCSAPVENSGWSLMFVVKASNVHSSSVGGFKNVAISMVAILSLLGLLIMFIAVLLLRRRGRQAGEKNQRVINALSEAFDTVMYVPYRENKLEDTALFYRKSPRLSEIVPQLDTEVIFTKLLDAISLRMTVQSESDEFIAQTRRNVIMDRLSADKVYSVTFSLPYGGKSEYYRMQFSPIIDRGHANTGFVCGISNINTETLTKLQMQENLRQALGKAEYASKAKTSFLFNMSHDIRTPMNAILGFAAKAVDEIGEDDKVLDSLRKIQKAGDVLLSLINNVLEMSRIESGKITIADNKVDITDSFAEIAPVMDELAKSKRISIDYSFESVRDRYVHLDAGRVQRVLLNLISNAVKYTNAGGWVKVVCAQIPDDAPDTAVYRFSVEDNGIGISEDFLNHMFEEFTREQNSTTSGIQGTGLGLALVKSLTELMGGTVKAVSTLGIGSKFTVEFRFRKQTEDELEPETEQSETEEQPLPLAGKKALLVEDNEFNREIAQYILEQNGIEISVAENGLEAVDNLRKNGPASYDFILMDIQMPVMDGYEASRTIRTLWPGDDSIVIIALSANAFEEDRRKSLECGMNDHLSKPINPAELIKTLKKYIKAEV